MTKKENLFYLIKSLTKAEKRYFNIFCFDNNISKNYLKLFDIISKQSKYNETVIRKKLHGQALLNQLHVAKNYLNQLILKSLRNYHSKISKEAEIKDSIRNIEILFYKELFDQCHYEIQKAEKLAHTFEDFAALVTIQKWKRQLLFATGKNNRNQIEKILTKEKEAIDALNRINQYWELTNDIFDYYNDKERRLSKHPLMRTQKMNESMATKILHHHILYSYLVINGKAEEGFLHLIDLVDYLEQFPHRISNNPAPYVTALNNKISFLIRSKKFETVGPLLEKVRAIPQRYKLRRGSKFSVKLELRTYNIELEMYRDTKNFSKGIELIKEIEVFLQTHKKSIPQEYYLLLWYQFANIYFMKKDFAASMKYVNEIVSSRFSPSTHDLERYARLLNLMIHLELDNIIVLKYAVEGCRRFLRKVKKVHEFEKVMLRFFSKICNAPKREHKNLFVQLYKNLFKEPKLVDDNVLDYLDFQTWIKEKLN